MRTFYQLNSKDLWAFFRFALAGFLGAVTNLMLFLLLVDVIHSIAWQSAVVCFVVAATQNYLVNHFWSFKKKDGPNRQPDWRSWMKYMFGSLAGLAINLGVLQLTLVWFSEPLFAQALGILGGFLVNYVVARRVVFRA